MGIRGLFLVSTCTLAVACSSGGDGGSGGRAGSGTIVAGSAATGAVGGVGGAAGTAAVPAGGTAGIPVAGSAGVSGAGVGGAAGIAGNAGVGGTGGVPAGGTGGAAGDLGGTGGTAGGTGGTASPTEVDMCIQMATDMGRTGDCPVCGCTNCLAELMACQDEACASVLNCGQDNGCVGTDCYCGDAAGLACLSAPTGACKNEIAEASGLLGTATCMTVDGCALGLIDLEAMDPDNPVVRAGAVSLCVTGRDADPGMPPLVPAVEEILGACETECTPM